MHATADKSSAYSPDYVIITCDFHPSKISLIIIVSEFIIGQSTRNSCRLRWFCCVYWLIHIFKIQYHVRWVLKCCCRLPYPIKRYCVMCLMCSDKIVIMSLKIKRIRISSRTHDAAVLLSQCIDIRSLFIAADGCCCWCCDTRNGFGHLMTAIGTAVKCNATTADTTVTPNRMTH